MEHVFIVNPISGKADASLYLVPQIIEQAKKSNISYRVEMTQAHRHAVQLAQAYAQAGDPVAYACGGDGPRTKCWKGCCAPEIMKPRWPVFRAGREMIMFGILKAARFFKLGKSDKRSRHFGGFDAYTNRDFRCDLLCGNRCKGGL